MIPEPSGPSDPTRLPPAAGVEAPDSALHESIGWVRRGVWLYAASLGILLVAIGLGAAIGTFYVFLPFVLLGEPGVPASFTAVGLLVGISFAVSLVGLVAWREGARSLPHAAAGLGFPAVASAETAKWAHRRSVICLWLVPAVVLLEVLDFAYLFQPRLEHCPVWGCGPSPSPNLWEVLPAYLFVGGLFALWCLIAAVFLYSARSLVAAADVIQGRIRRRTRRFAGAVIFVGGSLAPVPTVLALFTAGSFSGGIVAYTAVPPTLVLLGLTILGTQLRIPSLRFPAPGATLATPSR